MKKFLLTLLIVLFPTSVFAAFAAKQSVDGGVQTSPATVVLSSGVNVGDLINVCVYQRDGSTIPAMSDNLGNNYTQVGTAQQLGGGATIYESVWYSVVTTGGASVTITANSGTLRFDPFASSWTGTGITQDQTNQANGVSNVPLSGNMVTVATSALVIGCIGGDGGSNTWTANANYTLATGSTANNTYIYRITTAGTHNPGASASFGVDWAEVGVIFKEASAAASNFSARVVIWKALNIIRGLLTIR